MAKKKSSKKKTRRRRIGAMALNASSPIVQWGSIGLGYLLMAKPIANMVDKAFANETDPTKVTNGKKMVYGGMTLGGAYFGFMKGGKKSTVVTLLSGIAIGAGLKNGLAAFGIGRVGGYGNVPVLGGYGNVPVLGNKRPGGYIPQGTLAGGYSVQSTLNGQNVMGSVDRGNGNGSGSGLIKDGGSSLMG